MRAIFGGSGLVLTLLLKDKEEGNRTGILECQLAQWKKARVILHIVNELNQEEFKEKGFLEEPGFHIEAIPKNAGPENEEEYDIYLTKARFAELTSPKGDSAIDGGYFVSRCMYDRVDICYWEI